MKQTNYSVSKDYVRSLEVKISKLSDIITALADENYDLADENKELKDQIRRFVNSVKFIK